MSRCIECCVECGDETMAWQGTQEEFDRWPVWCHLCDHQFMVDSRSFRAVDGPRSGP